MKGSDQYPQQHKIFFWDEKLGVQLFAQREPSMWVDRTWWYSTNGYNLVRVFTSSDGRSVVATGLADCTFSSMYRLSVSRYEAVLYSPGEEPAIFSGRPTISSNGQFLGLGSPHAEPYFFPAPCTVSDLSMQERREGPTAYCPQGRHAVGDDGTIVYRRTEPGVDSYTLRRWSGETVSLPAFEALSSSGSRVFYREMDGLFVRDISIFGNAQRIATLQQVAYDPLWVDISEDGSFAAFVQSGQVWTVRGDGSGLTQATRLPDSVVDFALSGDGNYLFASTDQSRIVRIDLRTAAIREIVPRSAALEVLPVGFADPIQLTPGGVLSLKPRTPTGAGWLDLELAEQLAGPFQTSVFWAVPVRVQPRSPDAVRRGRTR